MVEIQALAQREVRPGEVRNPLAEVLGICKLGVVMEEGWQWGPPDSGSD